MIISSFFMSEIFQGNRATFILFTKGGIGLLSNLGFSFVFFSCSYHPRGNFVVAKLLIFLKGHF